MSADLTSLIAAHRFMARNAAGRMGCRGCPWSGTKSPGTDTAWAEYAEHLAAVIEDSEWLRERQAEAVEAAAEAWAREWHAVNFNKAGRNERPWQRQTRWLRDRAQAIREGGDYA